MITNILNANKIQNQILLINLTKFPIDRTNSDGRSNPLLDNLSHIEDPSQ